MNILANRTCRAVPAVGSSKLVTVVTRHTCYVLVLFPFTGTFTKHLLKATSWTLPSLGPAVMPATGTLLMNRIDCIIF